MEGRSVQRPRVCSCVVCGGVLAALIAGNAVHAQPPPPAVTPGAVQPRLEEGDQVTRDRVFRNPPATVEIPPVLDRPLPMTGERIAVRGFTLNLPPASGFARLRPELEQLLAERLAGQPSEGYFLAQLEEITAELTARLREAGFIVSRAYLPVQTVRDGVIEISVVPGRLGEVRAEGNNRYSEKTIRRAFAGLEGEPVQLQQLNAALLRLLDYPGLQPFGVLSPGSQLGETDLTVRVTSEEALDFSLTANNYGNEFTGDYQALAQLDWFNPTGAADQVTLRLLQSFEPADSLYGSFDYVRPLPLPALALGASFFTNAYQVGRDFVAADTDGRSLVGSLFLDYEFLRRRTRTGYLRFDLARKNTRIRTGDEVSARDNLTVAGAELGFELIDRFRGANQIAVTYSRGFNDFLGAMDADGDDFQSSRQGSSGASAPGKFQKVAVRVSRLQRITENHSLLLRGFYQHSDDLLVSLEQLALGGPYNARAYPVSQRLVDSGGFFSAEWVMRAPGFAGRPAWGGRTWGDVVSFSLFYDYAGGRVNDLIDNASQGEFETTDLSGVGVGLDFRFSRRSQLRFDISTALSDVPQPDNDVQVYGFFFIEF